MEEFLRSLFRNALSILKKIHAQNIVEDFLEKLRQSLIIIGQEQKIYPNKPSVWKKFIGSFIEKRLVTEPSVSEQILYCVIILNTGNNS